MHFPDTDPRWKDADSLQFLRHACDLIRAGKLSYFKCGFHSNSGASKAEGLSHGDPRTACRNNGFAAERISVKFKTSEKVGPVGEGRSAEAQAIVTLIKE